MSALLPRKFFEEPAPLVAPRLIGSRLVHRVNGERLAGIICEVEAYEGEIDLASHARMGRTARNSVMYGEAGHAYIYFTYGMHWLFNIVTEPEGLPSAVLVRALYPVEGLEWMAQLRARSAFQEGWLNGPAKLTQAMGLDGKLNGANLCAEESDLFLEADLEIPAEMLHVSARVGLGSTPEPWLSQPWRWFVERADLIHVLEQRKPL